MTPATPQEVIAAVSMATGVQPRAFGFLEPRWKFRKGRVGRASGNVLRARAIAARLMRECCHMSLCQIGGALGGLHHATVLYYLKLARKCTPSDVVSGGAGI